MYKKFLLVIIGVFLISFVFATGMPNPFGDYDSDGVLNINDNCYYVYNPFQVDSDSNGYGNCCDANYIMNKNPNVYIWCDDPNQNFCGDGICNNNENYLNCLSDCPTPPANNTNQPESKKTIDISHRNHFVQFCDVNWKCNDWSDCVDGEQTRTCTDLNSCGTNLNKPPIFQECALTPQTTSRNFLTGAVTGITNFATSPGGIATSSGLIIILIGSIILVNFRKNRLSKEK